MLRIALPLAVSAYARVGLSTLEHLLVPRKLRESGLSADVALAGYGTVTGMVATFDVITLYGNQNPVLMADGISEALISTQSGLLVAFPLTLLRQRLAERIEYLGQQIALGATVIENLAGRG